MTRGSTLFFELLQGFKTSTFSCCKHSRSETGDQTWCTRKIDEFYITAVAYFRLQPYLLAEKRIVQRTYHSRYSSPKWNFWLVSIAQQRDSGILATTNAVLGYRPWFAKLSLAMACSSLTSGPAAPVREPKQQKAAIAAKQPATSFFLILSRRRDGIQLPRCESVTLLTRS